MKIKNQSAKIILFIISMAFIAFIDLYFAKRIYLTYEPVVKGIIGMTLLVLIYRYIIPKRLTEEPIQVLFTSTGLKFLLYTVFWAIVGYWAFIEMDGTILYLVKLFKNN